MVQLYPGLKSLFAGLALALMLTSCHKEKDDCVKPNTTQQQSSSSTARSMRGDGTSTGTSTDAQLPSIGYRNVDVIDTDDPDGSGISDDGQDEADGESSTKKSRLSH